MDKNKTNKANPKIVHNENVSVQNNADVDNNQNKYTRVRTNLPFQSKARRKEINFMDDCQYTAGIGDEYFLENTCADTLRNIQPELPDEDCAYDLIKRDVKTRLNGYSSIKFYSLSPNKYLVEVLCRTGAYNILNVYLLYDESAIPAKAKVLEFPYLEFTHDEDSDVAKTVEKVKTKVIGGRYFDLKTKKLIVFVKARGIGDAGRYARYSFPNGKPKLEEFRAKFKWEGQSYQAGDAIKFPPKTWKRYYPK